MRWTVLLLAACAGTESEAPPAPEPDQEAVRAHMKVHWEQGVAARDAVMMGDLASVRTPLAWIATHTEHPDVPDNPMALDAMKKAAAEGASAEDARTAGRAVARVAMACGVCHAQVDGGPTFSAPDLPSLDHASIAHMARHRWAADRMWDALVVPSDEAWQQAVAVLAEGVAEDDDFPEALELPPESKKLRAEVHEQAQREMPTAPLRADVYGTLLAACAQCHWAVGVTPNLAPTPR